MTWCCDDLDMPIPTIDHITGAHARFAEAVLGIQGAHRHRGALVEHFGTGTVIAMAVGQQGGDVLPAIEGELDGIEVRVDERPRIDHDGPLRIADDPRIGSVQRPR